MPVCVRNTLFKSSLPPVWASHGSLSLSLSYDYLQWAVSRQSVTESTAEEGICCGRTLVINLCLLLFQEVPLNIGRAGACVVVVKLPWRLRVPELWPQKEACNVNSRNALFTFFIKAIVTTGFISTDLNNLVQFILFLLRYFSTITDWEKRKIRNNAYKILLNCNKII